MAPTVYSTLPPTASPVGCVYLAFCALTQKAYIGKSIRGLQARQESHVDQAARGRKTHFHNALRKHGADQFTWSELYLAQDDDALLCAEVELVGAYKAAGIELYNMTLGGEGRAGSLHSPETKRMMSESHARRLTDPAERAKLSTRAIKRCADPAVRAKMSASATKRSTDPLLLAKLGAAQTRLWQNPEHRAKMLAVSRQRWADPDFKAATLAKRAHTALINRAKKAGLRYCRYRKAGAYHSL